MKHKRSMLKNFFAQLQRRLAQRRRGHVALPRGECAGVKGRDVSILSGNHPYRTDHHPHGFCHHLREHRIGALADFGRAALYVDRAVLVEQQTRPGDLYANRPGVGGVAKTGHPDATPQIALLAEAGCPARIPLKYFAAFNQAFRQAGTVNDLVVYRTGVSFTRRIKQADLHRIDAEFGGGVV